MSCPRGAMARSVARRPTSNGPAPSDIKNSADTDTIDVVWKTAQQAAVRFIAF